LLAVGVVMAACIAALSYVVYTAFNQPLVASGFLVFLVAGIILLVVVRIAFINRMMPSKQKAGEQANF
jgi:hypothetical protein